MRRIGRSRILNAAIGARRLREKQMHQPIRRALFANLLSATALLFSAPAARAIDISDLRTNYGGPAHGTINPSAEHSELSLKVLSKLANGNFTADAGVVPVKGKVNTK